MREDLQFELGLSAILAHSLVLESKGAEPWGQVWAVNGGDPPAPTTGESTEAMMQALQKELPGYMETLRKQVVPTAQAELQGAQEVSPGYANLTADIYDTVGRRLNKTGEEIAASNQLAKAQSDADVLKGPGMDIIKSADAAQRLIDPEFYNLKEATGKLGTGIINSYGGDPTKLTGSERAEVERGLAQEGAQRGTLNSPSAINTVENAMAFGSAAEQKRQGATNTLAQLATPMTATRSGVDVLQQATGRPGQTNSGAGQFTGAQMGAGTNNAFGQGQALMGQTGENQRTAMNVNAQRRSGLDMFNQTASAMGNAVGCCFIMLEGHNGVLPWWVRAYRDLSYSLQPEVAVGYKWMAKWLVPLMQKSKLIKGLVNDLLVAPLTAYGGWFYNVPGYEHGKCYAGYKNFWFKVWKLCAALPSSRCSHRCSAADAAPQPRSQLARPDSPSTLQSGANAGIAGRRETTVPSP